MAHSQQREALAQDMDRLQKQLRGLCEGRLSPADEIRLRVLDLACGECHEAEMLKKVMRQMAAGEGREHELSVDFIGTDIRDREIERAAERCGKGEDGVDYRFMVKDGQKLTQDADLAEGFDVVFVRHQNYYLGGKEWHAIFEQSLEKLAPDGKLIITSYFDHEHDLAKDAIQKVGGELIDEIANQEARSLATKGKFVDKRLAMFRRRD